ncbi:MAG: cysteine hydrolase [Bacilli bacterium]|nr:cysteine hydrolase [Bacilli bacterium]
MELTRQELVDLIKRYYVDSQNFVGEVEIGIERWWNKNDTGYRPRVDLDGYLNFYNKRLKVELTLDEKMMKQVIKNQLKKEGYKVEEIKFNCDEKEFKTTEITVNENKKEGVIHMKNLEMYEGCLIVVDMVNGFVREGVLHDEKIADIIPRQIELIKEAKNEGKLIVFIKDTHNEDAAEFERFGNTQHCVEGTNEAELVDELKEFEKDGVAIQKNSTCFMEAPEFRYLMELQKEMKEFDIVGCCTDICVVNGAIALANYLDQQDRKHIIKVHEDAIATYNENNRKEYVDAAKLLMEQQGIQLVKKGR